MATRSIPYLESDLQVGARFLPSTIYTSIDHVLSKKNPAINELFLNKVGVEQQVCSS